MGDTMREALSWGTVVLDAKGRAWQWRWDRWYSVAGLPPEDSGGLDDAYGPLTLLVPGQVVSAAQVAEEAAS